MLNSKRVTAECPEEYPQEDMPSITEEHLQNKELCAECGGRCCKNACRGNSPFYNADNCLHFKNKKTW